MATFTPNNNLKKPAGTDYVLIGDLNGNMDIIDNLIGKLPYLTTSIKTNLVEAINEMYLKAMSPPPYLNSDTGTWWQWDMATAQFIDTKQKTQGDAAGFGVPTSSTTTIAPQMPASVSIVASGPDTKKVFAFNFNIPQGVQGLSATFTVIQAITGAPGTLASIAEAPNSTPQDRKYILTVPKGFDGKDGKDFIVLGLYETIEKLRAAHPIGGMGDAYLVGTATENNVYLWDVDSEKWVNIGNIQGPPSDVPGPVGPQGPPGNVLFASFELNLSDRKLYVITPDGYDGIEFKINYNSRQLEAWINE